MNKTHLIYLFEGCLAGWLAVCCIVFTFEKQRNTYFFNFFRDFVCSIARERELKRVLYEKSLLYKCGFFHAVFFFSPSSSLASYYHLFLCFKIFFWCSRKKKVAYLFFYIFPLSFFFSFFFFSLILRLFLVLMGNFYYFCLFIVVVIIREMGSKIIMYCKEIWSK